MQHNRHPIVANSFHQNQHYKTFTSGFGTKSYSNLHQEDRRFTQTSIPSFSKKQPHEQIQKRRTNYERISRDLPQSQRTYYTPITNNQQYSSMLRNQSSPNIAIQALQTNIFKKPIQQSKPFELTSKDYLINNNNKIKSIIQDSIKTQNAGQFYFENKTPSTIHFTNQDFEYDYKTPEIDFKVDFKGGKTETTEPQIEITKLVTSESVGLVLDSSMSDLKSVQTLFNFPHIDSPKQFNYIPNWQKPVIETIQENNIFQRKNNQETQMRSKRQLSLPFNSSGFSKVNKSNNIEDRQKSQTKTDINGYISSINDKNKKISQLQSKIVLLQHTIVQKQSQIQKAQSSIKLQKQNHRQIIDKYHKQMNKLKKQIDLNQSKRHSNNLNLEQKFHKINLQNQQINANNNVLQKQIANLKKDLDKKRESEDIHQQMYEKLKAMVLQKTNKSIEFEKFLNKSNEENIELRKKLSELVLSVQQSKEKVFEERDENQMFNQIVKMNQEQNIKYKNNIAIKDSQIHRLEDLNRELRATNDTLRNDLEIEKLKRITDLKNSETNYKIEQQVHLNEINSLNRVLKSLQEKLKFIINQDKKKDEFMTTYLKNRVETPQQKIQIQQIFKKYELISINTNIIQCLKRQQQQIDSLKAEIRRLILRK